MSDTTELVDLAVIFPDLEIELKYACADNITGKAIYQQARCLLHKDAITALAKSISIAQLSGLQLVIYDAYRPQQAQAMLWQASVPPAAQRNRLLLNAIMTGGGFVGISSEWWHFELPQAASYPLLADQFTCFISPGTQHVS
ncbi:D-alanyl-D-alanine dipeptidase [Escherichia coli]|uniref:M15 family metallopeptidase n=1 Tax=Escherichia coli TaxID=562 RepID=UPI00211D82FC|nr:M15 family metallopeptidase [Escherichia coli]UUN54244.1 D-alanyl-D-alanine dipeptidase [Escherichia coli]